MMPADRAEVRAILVAADAPAEDLEWLVESCPSVADARSYRPPPRLAWCARCDGVRVADSKGCATCREATELEQRGQEP